MNRQRALVGPAAALLVGLAAPAAAQAISREQAARAAIHPVADARAMTRWLGRVPVTHDFPPDLAETLRGTAGLFVIEMTTAPDCLPCGDLWVQLRRAASSYGWRIRTLSGEEALLRSGKLGIPWVGHPVAWVRPSDDPERSIPIAIGTDRAPNLLRNIYLAAKMLTGVRPAVAVRAMSKFTGIVGATSHAANRR